MGKFLKSNFLLIIILAVAVFFRFWQITALPGGLFPDEAANGLDVNSILKGDVRPFYERGNGREALFFYTLAGSVALFGRGPWQHHIVSAAFSFFTLLAAYFLTKRLFNKNIAMLAAFFMAISSYAVTVSRTAFRANTAPLFSTLTLLFLVRAVQEKNKRVKVWSASLAGLCFGLGFYTYISFRMMIPLLLVLGTALIIGNRKRLKKTFKPFTRPAAAFGAAFAAAFAWLATYFAKHPENILGRAGQVSVFNPDLNQGDVLGTFLGVVKATIVSFFTSGDLNWRHNVSGYPFLSPFLSPFFGLTLIVFTVLIFRLAYEAEERKIRRETFSAALIALWFWFMTVPEITTAEGIPHGLRLTGVIPAIFILAAWGISWLWEILKDKGFLPAWRTVYAVVFLSALAVYNFSLYFGAAANSPDYYYAFRSDLTGVSNYLNTRNLPSKTYLSLDKFSVQTVEYLTTKTNQPYILIDPAQSYKVMLSARDQIIFTMSTMYDRIKFLETNPGVSLVYSEQNKFGQATMLVYEKQ